ncbi:MAG: tripartite tricarboxylate transporter substrate binding protein [Clostridiales bacterium]|nr:tripartite tricarboxylate transporter substrate binding protein [Clostridiales bacterium]
MKKSLLVALLCATTLSTVLSGCSRNSGSSNEAFKPEKTIQWMLSSSPGGGSDIFTRMISGIMTDEDMVNGQSFSLTYKTDGSGEVVRNEVSAQTRDADYNLLTFNSGDIILMVDNSKTRAEDFNILSVMAVEHSLLLRSADSKYDTFADAIEAAKNGTRVVFGSSGGDQQTIYKSILAQIGVSEDVMPYVVYDSVSEGIVACLGGHVDFTLSGPASASEYVEAGQLVPVLALNDQRFGGLFEDTPTLSEIGDYEDVTTSQWRSVVGPKSMSAEAVAFWSDALKAVSESETWKNDYIEANQMTAQYMDHEAATAFVAAYEAECLANSGVEK